MDVDFGHTNAVNLVEQALEGKSFLRIDSTLTRDGDANEGFPD